MDILMVQKSKVLHTAFTPFYWVLRRSPPVTTDKEGNACFATAISSCAAPSLFEEGSLTAQRQFFSDLAKYHDAEGKQVEKTQWRIGSISTFHS